MRLGDTWVILGNRGAGKTTAMRKLATAIRRAYLLPPTNILDTKRVGDFDNIPGARYFRSNAAPPPARRQGDVHVWQPPDNSLANFDGYLDGIREQGVPALLLIDELTHLARGRGGAYPLGLERMFKLGRDVTGPPARQGITTLAGMQEIAGLPRQTIGQGVHFLRLHLIDRYDRREAGYYLGAEVSEPPDPHGLYYARLDRNIGIHYYQSIERLL